ncbi:MAG: transketolase [Candidatus Scalindua sp.]|nr:transketolase [Candidatus Scalindua sp.]
MNINKIRSNSLISIYQAESGHPGGVLSSIDLIAYLFMKEMNYDKKDFSKKERDRFILSKGHCAPALYAVAAEVEIIDKSRLNGLRKLNHELQGHTHRGVTPWVEASTGSLGQGFSFAIGEAKGLKMQNIDNRVYVMLGDGELQEGEVWEGVMFAGHHRLDNLCTIIDYNKMQSDDLNENIMGLEPLADKWQSFNWHVIEIDGHNFDEMEVAFNKARARKDKPTVIIAHTIKGKGVSYMEGSPVWHGSLKLSDEDLSQALLELGATEEEIKGYLNE